MNYLMLLIIYFTANLTIRTAQDVHYILRHTLGSENTPHFRIICKIMSEVVHLLGWGDPCTPLSYISPCSTFYRAYLRSHVVFLYIIKLNVYTIFAVVRL